MKESHNNRIKQHLKCILDLGKSLDIKVTPFESHQLYFHIEALLSKKNIPVELKSILKPILIKRTAVINTSRHKQKLIIFSIFILCIFVGAISMYVNRRYGINHFLVPLIVSLLPLVLINFLDKRKRNSFKEYFDSKRESINHFYVNYKTETKSNNDLPVLETYDLSHKNIGIKKVKYKILNYLGTFFLQLIGAIIISVIVGIYFEQLIIAVSIFVLFLIIIFYKLFIYISKLKNQWKNKSIVFHSKTNQFDNLKNWWDADRNYCNQLYSLFLVNNSRLNEFQSKSSLNCDESLRLLNQITTKKISGSFFGQWTCVSTEEGIEIITNEINNGEKSYSNFEIPLHLSELKGLNTYLINLGTYEM